MRTERESNRSNTPHPAEYAARQDRLKRSLELIYTVAESTQAQDMLGVLAVRLVEAIDYVRFPMINHDGSIQEIYRWVQKPVIPLVALRPGQEVQLSMVGITDRQYFGAKEQNNIHPIAQNQITRHFYNGKTSAAKHNEKFSISKGASGSTYTKRFPIFIDHRKKGSPEVGAVFGQPSVAVDYTSDSNPEDILSHELTHALDILDDPVWLMQRNEPREKHTLRRELRGYAVGARISLLIAQRQGLNIIDDEEYFRSVGLSHHIERIRNRINGPIDSPNAFDPNDEIMQTLDRDGLSRMWDRNKRNVKNVSPPPSPQ